MPHMTYNYMFEMKATGVAARILNLFFPMGEYRTFLLELTEEEQVASLSFEDIDGRLAEFKATDKPFIYYDPLDDGMEYISMQWNRVSQETMERLCGHNFEESDFQSLGHSRGRKLDTANEFPTTWCVMF